MTTENFRAGVQYGDFKGTAQADSHDSVGFREHLTGLGLIEDGEFLIGIEAWSGEVIKQPSDKAFRVIALLAKPGNYENIKVAIDTGNPLPVRRVDVEMPPDVFFGFFKRFSIALSPHGLLDGKEVTYAD